MTGLSNLKDRFSMRLARLRRSAGERPLFRMIGGRGAAAIFLGTALSVGGITDTLANVQFLVKKDLETVSVVKRSGADETIIANLKGDFRGNTLFKLSQVLPDRYVTRELSLFDGRWVDTASWLSAAQQDGNRRDVFYEEMKRINDSIRAEFFANEIPFGRLIHEKSEKYGVDPALVAAVIEQESHFRPRARSHVGATGLMQLMPRTGRWMGARNLYDPEQNIDAGVKYIKYLDGRFNGDLTKTLAAYNAGEGNVQKYRGVPPFRETRQYVKKVMQNYDKRTRQLEKFQSEQLGGSIPDEDGQLALR
jgi:soluble lytic murein transglycosylase-like protein